MTNILILGANGQIARVAVALFLERPGVRLTLYLRNARRLESPDAGDRVHIVEGDVRDRAKLEAAMAGQDTVYANLAGDLEAQARQIVDSMRKLGLEHLIFVSSMGIYDETPGQHFGSVLDPYRNAAKIVEASGLDYAVIRPAWLNDRNEIAYGTTEKGESFANPSATVSRKSVADLVVKLATAERLGQRSIGVHRAD